MDNFEDKFDFTNIAWENLYDVVDNPYFLNKDANLIYESLEKRIKLIPFGEYLKRYIYKKTEMEDSYEDIPLKEYQMIIKYSFEENNTPKSFEPTSAKLSALSRNWLTQQSVRRNVVFLLGFGLNMSVRDVNDFLKKGLREQGINAKNPFEVICWYCYKNGYQFAKFQELYDTFQKTAANSVMIRPVLEDYTVGVRNSMYSIYDDESLMAHLCKLKTDENNIMVSVTARKHFDRLYDEARTLIAEEYTRNKVYEKQAKEYTKEDITEADLEHVICSAIPLDRNGNLSPAKASTLNKQFAGKRFSRQRMNEILSGKSDVNRFDLITLNFFIYSQSLDKYPSVKKRYASFIEATNKILSECYLEDLYIANPYECFILMCILAEEPMVTYADVLELSYSS